MTHRLSLAALAALTLLAVCAHADDAKKDDTPGPWKFGTQLGLNLSQSSFSTNWSGGDQGSIVWVVNTNSSAERQVNERFNTLTTLQLAYGQTSTQASDPNHPGQRVWSTPDKTTDQMLFESTGRFTLDAFADPYVALRAESQFEDRTDPRGSIPVNPVKLKESAGLARVLFKTDEHEGITRVGFGIRQAFGRVFVDSVNRRSFTTTDGGLEWQTDIKQPILQKKVLYTGALLVFQPLFFSKANALEQFDRDALAADPTHEAVADFWKATNVNFQNTFSAQITKSLSVNLFAQWIYLKFDNAASIDNTQPLVARTATIDHAVRKAGQFKETLALGFTYRLF